MEVKGDNGRPANILITGKKGFRSLNNGVGRAGGPHGEIGKVEENCALCYPHKGVEVLVDSGKIEVLCVDPDAKVQWVQSKVR